MPWVVCIAKSEAKSPEELSISEGDVINAAQSSVSPLMFYGRKQGGTDAGRFPAANVRGVDPSVAGTLEVAAALFDWAADPSLGPGYVNLKEGHAVQVVEKLDSGWWRGITLGSGGLFPVTL